LETAEDVWQRISNWVYEVMLQSESETNKSDNEDSKEEEEESRKVLVVSLTGTLRLLLHHLAPDGHSALKITDDQS
jgi:broad specificity phosphatase PhoE